MWLINCETMKLECFDSEDVAPPYAILSHTWGDDEVAFSDIDDPIVQGKAGFSKIRLCCDMAKIHELKYAWVDTCCIDKRSSAELSEAINSMFRWYRKAVVCYAYLSDVPSDVDLTQERSAFAESRWFTRGWTLQELIAPLEVEFYSNEWQYLGSRSSLFNLLSRITGIDSWTLQTGSFEHANVAQKMFWASRRKTSRVEDIAYCLLGLFEVHMPLLYGEREKAFVRLQEEIAKTYEDQSLFAWRASQETEFNSSFDLRKQERIYGDKEKVSNGSTNATSSGVLQGLLASSPADFAFSGNVRTIKNWQYHGGNLVVRNKSVKIELPLIAPRSGYQWDNKKNARVRDLTIVPLGCRILGQWEHILALRLLEWDSQFYGRYGDPVLIPEDDEALQPQKLSKSLKMVSIKAESPMQPEEVQHGDILLSIEKLVHGQDSEYTLSHVHTFGGAVYDHSLFVLKPAKNFAREAIPRYFRGFWRDHLVRRKPQAAFTFVGKQEVVFTILVSTNYNDFSHSPSLCLLRLGETYYRNTKPAQEGSLYLRVVEDADIPSMFEQYTPCPYADPIRDEMELYKYDERIAVVARIGSKRVGSRSSLVSIVRVEHKGSEDNNWLGNRRSPIGQLVRTMSGLSFGSISSPLEAPMENWLLPGRQERDEDSDGWN